MYPLCLQGKKDGMILSVQKKRCSNEEELCENYNLIAIKNDLSPIQHLILLDILAVSNHT